MFKKRIVLMVVLTIALLTLGSVFATGGLPYDPLKVNPLAFQEIGEFGGTFVAVLTAMPAAFSFYGAMDGPTFTISAVLNKALVGLDPVTGHLIPFLARGWEVSPDGLEVIFHLRRGLRWSDGAPFTADDVIFTLHYVAMNTDVAAFQVARYTIAGERIRFEKIDTHTVKAILPVTYGAFFNVLSHSPILPKHRLAQHVAKYTPGVEPGAFNRAWAVGVPPEDVVGTGAFRLVSYTPGVVITLERNPYFWMVDPEGNQLPYLDRLIYRIVPSAEVRTAMFLAGELNSLSIPPADFSFMKGKSITLGGFRVFVADIIFSVTTHLAFNFDVADEGLRPFFRNERFRQAMSHAVDIDSIIDVVYGGLAIRGGTPVPPANKAFFNPAIEKYRDKFGFDLEKAAAILDELGLHDTDGDGWRELPDGRKLRFVLTTSVDRPPRVEAAGIILSDLEKIGVKVDLRLLMHGLVSDLVRVGDFEAMLWGWGNLPDPQLRKAIWQPGRKFLYYFHRSTVGEVGPIFEAMFDWEKRIFELFEKGEREMDHARRWEYYAEWQLIMARRLPVIFLTKPLIVSVVRDNVGNSFIHEGIHVAALFTIFERRP